MPNLNATRPTFEDRFWSKVSKSESCWEWSGARTPEGYGKIRENGASGKMLGAHRVAYLIANGEIPAKMFVDHMCHNRGCVNPAHLRLASQKQNQENRAGSNRNSASGVRGVSRQKGKWLASVRHNNIQYRAGVFATIEEAAEAVSVLRRELLTHSILDGKPSA